MDTQFVDNPAAEPATAENVAADIENIAVEPRTSSFADMDCETMLQTFANLLQTKPIQTLRTTADEVKTAFYKRQSDDFNKLRIEFTSNGGKLEDFVPPKDELEQRLKDLIAKHRSLYNDFRQKSTADREQNFLKKEALTEQLKKLLEPQENFGAAVTEFKRIQEQWRTIGPVAPAKNNEVWNNYNYVVEKFYDMVKISKELRELDFKKNFELKQLLCEKAESLLEESNMPAAAKQLQKYHQQWREVGPTAPEHRETLWERFSAASVIINKKNAEYFEQKKGEQQNNLSLKERLCEQVEKINAHPPTTLRNWTNQADEVIEIQQRWKDIGAVSPKDNEKVYPRFKSACNHFFDARKDFAKKASEQYEENVQKKISLCERAESLSTCEDWDRTTLALIALQRDWKNIGAVPTKISEELWNRFKNACNIFFDRKKEYFATHDKPEVLNLKAKEALIAEMQTCAAGASQQENLAIADKIQQRWTEIGGIPKKDAERIRIAYRTALTNLYKTLNISENYQRIHNFKQQLELDKNPQHLRIQHDKIVRQIKFLEEEKRVFENNISFFGRSKNAEQYTAEFSAKIDKHNEEINLLKEKLKIMKQLNA
jgi:archaellum component FlaC